MTDHHDDERERGKIWAWAALFVAMPILYVLSYAPAQRLAYGTDSFKALDGGYHSRWECAYTPVKWLIDETRLRTPLLHWADAWDVRECHTLPSFFRWFESSKPNEEPWWADKPQHR